MWIQKKHRSFFCAVGMILLLQGSYALSTDEGNSEDMLQDPVGFPALSNFKVGSYLGWVNDADFNSLCGGYYQDQPIEYTGPKVLDGTDSQRQPVQLRANSSDFHFYGKSSYKDGITITQPGRQITADNAYSFTNTDGNLEQINLLGQVHFREPGMLIIADTAHIPIVEHSSQFQLMDVIYRISLNETRARDDSIRTTKANILEANTDKGGLTAWGSASEMDKKDAQIVVLKDATYTTCPPTDKACDWQFIGKQVVLDDETGRGHIYHSILRVKNIPVMYFPFISFPINKDRQSGFLFPTFIHSSDSGFGLGLPYYWNMAANYDVTFLPNFFEQRGVLFNTDFRYLTAGSGGNVMLDIIPDDSEFASFQDSAKKDYTNSDNLSELESASDTRTAFRWLDRTTFDKHWLGQLDYNYVSDDYFVKDFGASFGSPVNNQLLRQGVVNYYGKNWNFMANLQSYQTLHPVDENEVENQYARLPQLLWSADYPDNDYGLAYKLGTEYDYFWMTRSPSDDTDPTTGSRFNFQPSMSKSMTKPFGYITPTAQVNLTSYQLTDPEVGNPSTPSRVIPTVNVDSGLTFQRETHYFGRDYTQTFEPRLYYLYTPNTNQDDLPNFDSVLYTLTYEQLFQPNRFSSVDRIGDANQVSFGATTRYIDQTSGVEKFNASIGDIWYFRDRDVTLCTTQDCEDYSKQEFSSVISEFNYRFSSEWSLSGDTSWDFDKNVVDYGSANFHYRRDIDQIFNLGYTYNQQGKIYTTDNTSSQLANISQLHASLQYPVSEQLSLLGSADFNLGYSDGTSFLLGTEYNSCCWAMRFIIDQSLDSVENDENKYDRVYYVQFVLKGLGAFGSSDPSAVINRNIAGYQNRYGGQLI